MITMKHRKRINNCQICGVNIIHRSPITKYCRKCSFEKQKQYQANYRKRKKLEKVKLNDR